MGRIERCTCRVSLSVTNAFVDMIKSSVKDAGIGEKINTKTWGCATLVDERWREDSGVVGAVKRAVGGALGVFANFLVPVAVATNVACTHLHIEYDIDVDMRNIVLRKLENGKIPLMNFCVRKTRINRIAERGLRHFPRLRRRLIHKEMEREISREFRREIRNKAGIFHGMSNAAVSILSIRVTAL